MYSHNKGFWHRPLCMCRAVFLRPTSSYQTCTAKLKWLPAVKIISPLLLQDSAQMIDWSEKRASACMPKLECILAFLRSVSILLKYINMVIDQLASATLLNGSNRVNYLQGCKQDAWLLQNGRVGQCLWNYETDERRMIFFIHIINYSYAVCLHEGA